MFSKIVQKIFRSGLTVAILLPVTLLAASSGTPRSDTYLMGIVPYYVYGYTTDMTPASVLKALTPPPVAPRLPIVGCGGRTKVKANHQ